MVLLAGLVLTACTTTSTGDAMPLNNAESQSTKIDAPMTITNDQVQQETSATLQITVYSKNDVATHSTPDDCLTIIDGVVYDLTPVTSTNTHPGGLAINMACGTDGTVAFIARNSKGPHPEKA